MDRFFCSLLVLAALFICPAQAGIIVSHEVLRGFSGASPAGELPVSFGIDSSDGVFFSDPAPYFDGDELDHFSLLDSVSGLGFTLYEGTYDTASGLPSTLGAINSAGSKIGLEAGGTSQDGAESAALGFDSGSVIQNSSNAMLIIDFSYSTRNVLTFAVDLLDLEGGNGRPAYLGVYDLAGNLIQQTSLGSEVLGDGFGNHEVISFLVTSDIHHPLGTLVFAVGDDDAGSTGGTERLAMADFYLQGAAPTAVPLPAAGWMMLSGLLGLFVSQRARRSIA